MSETYLQASQLRRTAAMTKAEATYLQLRELILDGSLEPGHAINQERLAADLGVSVTPLREALRRLETEELVTLSAHKIVSVLPLTWQELHDLCVTRQQLDPLAASLAATAATDQERMTIAAIASGPRPTDLRERLTAHREFHLAIYQASHNRVLAGILSQLWDRTNRYRITILRDRDFDENTGKEHVKLANAICDRKGETAADLMRHHVNEALRTFESTARQHLDDEDEIMLSAHRR